MPPRRRDVLQAFVLRFLVSFVPLVFLWLGIAPVYTRGIFAGANWLFQWDRPPVAKVGIGEDGLYAYRLTAEGPRAVFAFEEYGLFFNGILLAALLLATPGLRAASRAGRTVAGLALLAVVHVLFVVVEVKAQFVNLGLVAATPREAYTINWLAVLFGTLGEGLFPLLIAGGLTGRAWKEALSLQISLPARGRARRDASLGRNDPCPCGSGRKYKHCCGKER